MSDEIPPHLRGAMIGGPELMLSVPRTRTAEIAARLDDALAAEVAILVKEVTEPLPPAGLNDQKKAMDVAYENIRRSPYGKLSRRSFERASMVRYKWSQDDFDEWAERYSWPTP